MNQDIRLIVFDLDNTLYNWYKAFIPAFYNMARVATKVLSCNREQLLDELREVHVRHHNVEHPFALLETRIVQEKFPDKAVAARKLDQAFHAFNKTRKRNLRTFPFVVSTLRFLRKRQIKLVAHTDSTIIAAENRLSRLNLLEYFDHVFCRERGNPSHPDAERAQILDQKFTNGKFTELTKHQMKPNPEVIYEICKREGVGTVQTAYVGDSLTRDILMAKNCNVFAIWAAYGAKKDEALYARLVRISHWTDQEVQDELRYKEAARCIEPDFVCRRYISELRAAFDNFRTPRPNEKNIDADRQGWSRRVAS